MKILRLCFLATLVLTMPPAGAQPTPASPVKTAALAEELLTLFQIDKTMDGAIAQMTQMQEKMSASANLTPEQKERQARSLQAGMKEARAALDWQVIKPAFVQIYAEVFTEDELRGMIEFFKTPVGQKWIAKQPQLQAATMQKMQAIMMAAQPKIQAAIKGATSQP